MRFNLRLFHTGISDHNRSGVRPPRAVVRFLWSQPRLYSLYTRYRHGTELYNRDYLMVIDGFPRSGNSYSSQMMEVTQGRDFKFLSLCHCPPFLLAALEMGIPACLTFRKAEDSIVSWVLFRKLGVTDTIKLYIDFHRVLYPYRARLLPLNFTTLTGDFLAALRMINRRFGMNLVVPPDLEQSKKDAFARIDQYYEKQPGGFDPLKVARPHPQRDEMKEAVRQELHSQSNARWLDEARELYAAFDIEAQRELRNLSKAEAPAS